MCAYESTFCDLGGPTCCNNNNKFDSLFNAELRGSRILGHDLTGTKQDLNAYESHLEVSESSNMLQEPRRICYQTRYSLLAAIHKYCHEKLALRLPKLLPHSAE